VNDWLPPCNPVTTNVAVPPASGFVPRTALPSKKVTVPGGVPDPGASAVTVALRLTEEPNLVVDGAVAVNVTLWPDTFVPFPVTVVKVGDIPTVNEAFPDVLER